MNDYLDLIKQEFPDKAIDISESLQLLKESVTSLIDDISTKVGEAFDHRDFNSVDRYKSTAESASKYEKIITEYIDMFELEDINLIADIQDKRANIDEQRVVPNYEEYKVDNRVEHTLYENWMHKRPYGFRLIKDNLIEARTWNDVFVKVCEILFDLNSREFINFENIPYLNGKKKKYFSKNPKDLRKPASIRGAIYVETNHSANTFRNIILRSIKEYKLKSSQFVVYYYADYTELNGK